MAEKLDMKSMDITQGNIEKIRALFPSAVTEVMGEDGKVKLAIDFDALKQELSDDLISEKAERYQMTWPDKSKAKVLANSRITATLRPDKEKSVDFDTTENLYIEGDNLDVLKLLRETYLGKVKMIYIDPPYNTGNDFIYPDNFAMSVEDYAEVSGQYDEQGNRLVKNLDSKGRFHTDWLNMIYPRLKVARDLLTDDGVIFISIDDNEQTNLKKVCDEIFGADSFVTTLHVEMSATQGMKVKAAQNGNIVKNAEYILIYTKDGHRDIARRPLYDFRPDFDEHYSKFLTSDMKIVSLKDVYHHQFPSVNIRGLSEMYAEEPTFRKFVSENVYSICADDKITGFEASDFEEGKVYKIDKNERTYYIYNNGTKLRQLLILADSFGKCDDFNANFGLRKIRGDWWKDFYKDMGNVSKEGDVVYANGKKPVRLIKQLVSMATTGDDIIIDFFGGSCTTAHAVIQANAEDGCNRKFIMVQLPEIIDYSNKDNAKAYKDFGFKTVCDIGEERIRRAGKKILEELKVCGQERKIEGYTLLRSGSGGSYRRAEWKNNETGAIKTESRDVHEPNDFYKYYPNELDIGFRVLKLDSSNMQEVYYNPVAMTQDLLASTVDNVKADRTALDLLFQIMLDLGIELSAKNEEHTVSGKTYYTVNGNDIIACFDDDIDNDVIVAIAKQNPLYAVFKDKSFATDSVGINNEQLFKTYSPSTVVKVI